MRSFLLSLRAPRVACAMFAAATACRGDAKKSDDAGVTVAFGANATREPAMSSGDVKITSTDNALVLSVIGDTVRMQLSDSLRNSVAGTVDSSMTDKGAIGAAIAKSVTSVVTGALGFVVAINVNDIENMRYEGGHLRFDVKGGKARISSAGKSQDKAMFGADDAQRFIDAVHARQGPINR